MDENHFEFVCRYSTQTTTILFGLINHTRRPYLAIYGSFRSPSDSWWNCNNPSYLTRAIWPSTGSRVSTCRSDAVSIHLAVPPNRQFLLRSKYWPRLQENGQGNGKKILRWAFRTKCCDDVFSHTLRLISRNNAKIILFMLDSFLVNYLLLLQTCPFNWNEAKWRLNVILLSIRCYIYYRSLTFLFWDLWQHQKHWCISCIFKSNRKYGVSMKFNLLFICVWLII